MKIKYDPTIKAWTIRYRNGKMYHYFGNSFDYYSTKLEAERMLILAERG